MDWLAGKSKTATTILIFFPLNLPGLKPSILGEKYWDLRSHIFVTYFLVDRWSEPEWTECIDVVLNAATKGGGMYLIFPVIAIVLVLVIVLLQCLSYSFEQNWKVNIADTHYDYDYDNDKKQDTKSVLKLGFTSAKFPFWRNFFFVDLPKMRGGRLGEEIPQKGDLLNLI